MSEAISNLFEKKNTVADDEFDNFMLKVQEVKNLMDGLTSSDTTVANETVKLVDKYLANPNQVLENVDEDLLKVKASRTVINQKAFDNIGKESQQQTETPEAFMKKCEEDAKRRTEQRRMQKEASNVFKLQAISEFDKGEFLKALTYYNKAIDEFRGSAHLYQSRALTCIKLKLYKRTIEDCDLVLRCFNDKSLKALLYKAKAHQALGEKETADKYINLAIENHPNSKEDIVEYMGVQNEVEEQIKS